ncbi:MAG: ATP-binding protein [Thermoplasmatales archaeon]|nr:ATP-binding protein [Thermoplasmatales archaeon]
MKEYRPRYADIELKRGLEAFGAVLIEGPKWCGKTTTAEQVAKSAVYLQDEDKREDYRRMAAVKPSLLLQGEKPLLIDEWQMEPRLWDAIRFDVDRESGEGLYILTGSTVVDESSIKHSGAGRIKRMRMSTMSLFESGDSAGTVGLSDLFENMDIGARSPLALEDLARLTVRGGWPKTIGKDPAVARELIDGYCQTILGSDIKTVDGVQRDGSRMGMIMKSLSRNVSTSVANTKIQADLNAKMGTETHINTVRDYLGALDRLFVTQNLTAWNPRLRSKATVRTSDVRHFCDPAIAAYFLNASPKNLMDDLNTFGLLFESLAVRDLRAYSKPLGGDVFHYRDSNGLEADAIVLLRDGRWGAVEVKLGAGMIDDAAENLKKLGDTVESDAVGTPSFLAVVTGTEYAYRRDDGVYVVPLGCLRG